MLDLASLIIKADSSQVRSATGDLDKLSRSGKQTEGVTQQLGKGFSSLGGIVKSLLPIFGALSVAWQFREGLRQQEELQRNLLRTEQLLKSTGSEAWTSAKNLELQAKELASATLQSTEGIMSAQQKMLSFRNVTGEVFDRAMEAALNLSSVMGGDLGGAVLQVSKALEDPVQGLNALTRSGTRFTEQQKELITSLAESGRLFEAQNLILDELSSQYGGVARKEAEGFAGAQDTLSQSLQEARIALMDWLSAGERLSEWYLKAASALDEFTAIISSGQISYYIEAIAWQFRELGKEIQHVFGFAIKIIKNFFQQFADDGDSVLGWIRDAFIDMPSNIKAFVQLATVEIAVLVDKAMAYGKAIASYLNPKNWIGGNNISEELSSQLSIIDSARISSIQSILEENKANKERTRIIIEEGNLVRAEWERQAEAFEAHTARRVEGVNIAAQKEAEEREKLLEKKKEFMARELAAIDDHLRTEEEKMQEVFERRTFMVEEAFQMGYVSEEYRNEKLEQLEQDHQNRMNEIAYRGMATHEAFAKAFRNADIRNALAYGTQLTAGVASQNRKMFEVNKALALANAAVSLPDAVLQSFRNGGGYPWGLIPAGLMLAAGLAQISAIQGASYGGGGGSAPSVGGGAPATPVTPIPPSAPLDLSPQEGRQVTLQFLGDIYGWDDYIQEKVIQGVRDAVSNHDEVIVERGSRNHAEFGT